MVLTLTIDFDSLQTSQYLIRWPAFAAKFLDAVPRSEEHAHYLSLASHGEFSCLFKTNSKFAVKIQILLIKKILLSQSLLLRVHCLNK